MFRSIDEILYKWAHNKGLIVLKQHRDEEVRAMELTDHRGGRYGIGIEPPDKERDRVIVHAGAPHGRSMRFETRVEEIELALDDALRAIHQWKEEDAETKPLK